MTTERELGWDDEIKNDGPDFEILPEGDCDFEVLSYERARHGGSENLPPCNKAVVSIRLISAAGQTTIKHNLFLHTKTEGLICAYFTGCGLRKHGQKINMNFDKSVGCKGRCKVGIRKFTNDKGDTLRFNEIKKFYEPKAESESSQPAASAAPDYTPGQF